MKVNIVISASAQAQIRNVIEWSSRHQPVERVKEKIKTVILQWKKQIEKFPQSGIRCQYLEDLSYQEMLKDDYRFIYEINQTDTEHCFVYLHIFCHQRMDYKTLIETSLVV
ncbi:hypothetical protein PSECIP111951_03998 [Pseudoalteromonas holothuriae]|uniref:Uncharacterized protein n=1 Tax=Pseudoalteromonas holothuriae TaxID=2963714 RepID=A0A9W4R4L9_9GAMM|nr:MULTISPECIES: type II toxin-antitoxin system RelE/ParE family toxin [unclassified Pseudoalteromonas]CAH9066916.1 hypothetical protein PSECIP111854_03986 [Pseudoalteromonas sp. CIP111854]CAH9068061.1 hypothetical protein PSECIP111951_03998 [Pseudoalteromonas sp. CIP111951]